MDFDKDFESYLSVWYARMAEESDGEPDADEVLELVPDVYNEWANAPNENLGGVSPKGYFSAITAPEKLIDLFLERPCGLLYDRIAGMPECADGLVRIIGGNYKPDTRTDAAELLVEMGVVPPVALYARLAASPDSPDRLADLCTEILSGEFAAEAAPVLFELLASADEKGKARIAEILLCAPPDERTYTLLISLFQTGSNIAQYAGYLAKYGDIRAAQILYARLGGAPHDDYIELRNAIEALGGVVDE